MLTVNLNTMELNDVRAENEPNVRTRTNFPLLGAMGTETTSAVYIELRPGDSLGRHTDSAEEVLLILQGTVEVSVGQEKGRLGQNEMAVVPVMVPHDIRNVGQETARVLGFFGSANIVATFDVNWLPYNTHVIDTAAMSRQAATA